jgi:uncharacterized SAM-dependent methyltransferase
MQLATATKTTTKFYNDVMKGLRSSPKRLDSKYFYDGHGDELFPTDHELRRILPYQF